MQLVNMNEELFVECIEKSEVGGFSVQTDEHIFNLLNHYKDQKDIYVANFDTVFGYTDSERYESFGISVDKSKLSRNLDARNYLLIVEPAETKEETQNNCRSFVSKYLPEGKLPNYFVVNKNIKSYDELVYWNEIVLEIYPDSIPLNDHTSLKKERSHGMAIADSIAELSTIGKKALDISPYAESLVVASGNTSLDLMEEFKKAEKEILSKLDKTTVLVSNGRNSDMVCLLCSYMFYKHNVQSHLGYYDTVKLFNNVSTLLFDRNHMLAEEQIAYLKELPNVAFSSNDGYEFLVVLNKEAMSCRLTLSYMAFDSEDEDAVERMEVEIDQLSIIPIEFEFPMDDDDINVIRKEHTKLQLLQKKLEAKCNKFNDTVNVTNSFLFEDNGIKYIAHIEHWNLHLPAYVFPVHDQLVVSNTVLEIKDINRLYPVNILPGFEKHLKEFFAFVKAKGFTITAWNMRKSSNPLGLVLQRFNKNSYSVVSGDKHLNFMDLGLWWDETSKYRLFLLKQLSSHINLRQFRNKSDFITIFGGPHPMFGDRFVVTEEFLRG